MPETTDIFEVMSTMRAMRRLKPDPVPDELINKILQAAQWAPSGGNTQRWRFLVVKDPEIKKRVQVYYKRLYDETVGPRYASSAPPPGSDPARYRRQNAAVEDDGNGGTIDEAQTKTILALIKKAKVGPKFLKYMKAQSVEEAGSLKAAVATIAARDYRKAISTLKEQIAKAEASRADLPS